MLSQSHRFDLLRRVRRRLLWWRRVIVVSYPKSGRTWLRVMLDTVRIQPRFSHEGGDLGASREEILRAIEARRDYRVVFLYRHPIDTVVSWYHHAHHVLKAFDGTISDFVRDPRFGIEHILLFNQSWLGAAGCFKGFVAVTYEEMHTAPVPALRRVIDFMGLPMVSDDAISQAVHQNTFEKMRDKERQGELAQRFPGRFAENERAASEQAYKVRSGKVGGYRTQLSDEDIAYCLEAAKRAGWPLEELATVA
jgi:hypothetical protein